MKDMIQYTNTYLSSKQKNTIKKQQSSFSVIPSDQNRFVTSVKISSKKNKLKSLVKRSSKAQSRFRTALDSIEDEMNQLLGPMPTELITCDFLNDDKLNFMNPKSIFICFLDFSEASDNEELPECNRSLQDCADPRNNCIIHPIRVKTHNDRFQIDGFQNVKESENAKSTFSDDL